ncbi:MAG: hypothetical protein U0136_12420 [Bdellovibrionota bacterium]
MMIRRWIVCSMLALFPAFAASPAGAQNIDCLFQTKGKVVAWDKDWQMDALDNNVHYKVNDVKEIVKPGAPRTIELQLQAEGSAAKPKRTANIVKLLAARMFCDRVVGGLDDRSKGVQMALGGRDAARAKQEDIDDFFPSLELDPERLSFRRWLHGKWVPARANENEKKVVCHTQLLAFACSEQDAEWLHKQNLNVTKPWVELDVQDPLIRHTNAGWVRDDAIGPLIDTPMSKCTVAGKKFLCLSVEKEKYAAELKAIDDEVALQRKLHPPPPPVPVAQAKKTKDR